MSVDFSNSKLLKLAPADVSSLDWFSQSGLLGEKALMAFQGVRDSVVFTNRRIVLRNIKGVTGFEIALTTIPYGRIDAFTVESASAISISVTLTLYVGHMPPIIMEFTRDSSASKIDSLLSMAVIGK